MNDETRAQGAGSESPGEVSSDRIPRHCQACGVDLPPGHVYCTRVCAMWDRREHLDDRPGHSA
jgi:hypothetical protein